MIRYLTDFGLEHALQLTKYFVPFSSRSHMLLNGNTLANLEIYRNQTNYAERGSLFWILDHTSTSFGRRLLRRWVGKPLVDVSQLNERVNAVEEILGSDSPLLQKARELMKQLPDLEKGLCRIHYGKSSSSELLQILMALHKIADAFPRGLESDRFASPLLNSIFAFLPTVREDVTRYIDAVNPKAAETEDRFNLFRDDEKYPHIKEHKDEIADVERELEDHLEEVRKLFKKQSLTYVNVAQVEYLIEIRNTETAKVPKNWVKISGYHKTSIPFPHPNRDEEAPRTRPAQGASPNGLRSRVLQFPRVRYTAGPFTNYILPWHTILHHHYNPNPPVSSSEISEQYELFRDLVQQLAVLDCLFSLAAVACQPGYVKPEFVDDRTQIKVVAGRHPMVEQMLSSFVPNDVDFDVGGLRVRVPHGVGTDNGLRSLGGIF
ncbi:DNA mismatch repair protein MutS [Jimgerdemannia flammicorona]|uniref:DNA mismatch repair protein MutS n=1 Tax=Jimgerdemannia flammicorona TaxID=994334 RepID=A0A433QHR2_9FUNG|nr:DNA mismatch repair protein MutS [Jimgerdemannia flammicorona]